MRIIYKLLPTLLIIIPFACAREVSESARSIEERILKARIEVKYNDTLHKTASGLYYMIQAKGSGTAVQKENYVYIHYSSLDFNENYMWNSDGTVATSEEHVAKQLGVYSPATYYGPQLRYPGVNAQIEGIDEMMLEMREGDRRRIWLPSWLSSYGYSGSSQLFTTTTVHDIEVLTVVDDIEKYQIKSLESYRDKYYPGVDSLSYGFYKKTLKEGTGDLLTVGDNLDVWYVGRFLDHFIFDLNIADTAKKYNIYDSAKSYTALAGSCSEEETFSSTDDYGESVPMVSGFSKAIFNMKSGEEAVVFFWSDLGYGYEGSTDANGVVTIQPYTPLVFYLKVEKTNWDDET